MEKFSEEEIKLLREHLREINVIDAEGGGFTTVLVFYNYQKRVFPGRLSLADALRLSIDLGEQVGLPDEHVKVSIRAVHSNRLNDIHAWRASKQAARQGYGPGMPMKGG